MAQKNFFIYVLLCLLTIALASFVWLRFRPSKMFYADPELAKIMAVMDKYKTADLVVLYNGGEYKPAEFLTRSRAFLRRNFKAGNKAVTWITEHCYRSDEGNIIYFKYPDGSARPIRDVFLEELPPSSDAK